MDERECRGGNASPADRVIDLADRMRLRDQQRARRRDLERAAYTLFLVVSRAPQVRDHALFYVFLEGAPTMVAAAAFTREHRSLFGPDISIIDLRQGYENAMEVVETARRLRDAAPAAIVLAPSLGLGPRLARNG